jgi:hypothetical protein
MRTQSAEKLSFIANHKDVETAAVAGRLLKPLKKKDAGKPLPIRGRADLIKVMLVKHKVPQPQLQTLQRPERCQAATTEIRWE